MMITKMILAIERGVSVCTHVNFEKLHVIRFPNGQENKRGKKNMILQLSFQNEVGMNICEIYKIRQDLILGLQSFPCVHPKKA